MGLWSPDRDAKRAWSNGLKTRLAASIILIRSQCTGQREPFVTEQNYDILPQKYCEVPTVSLDAVYERLTQILQELFDDDALVAQPDLTADQVDGWDSFAQLRLIHAVEKTFGVEFAASQISTLQNVGELADLISSKVA